MKRKGRTPIVCVGTVVVRCKIENIVNKQNEQNGSMSMATTKNQTRKMVYKGKITSFHILLSSLYTVIVE